MRRIGGIGRGDDCREGARRGRRSGNGTAGADGKSGGQTRVRKGIRGGATSGAHLGCGISDVHGTVRRRERSDRQTRTDGQSQVDRGAQVSRIRGIRHGDSDAGGTRRSGRSRDHAACADGQTGGQTRSREGVGRNSACRRHGEVISRANHARGQRGGGDRQLVADGERQRHGTGGVRRVGGIGDRESHGSRSVGRRRTTDDSGGADGEPGRQAGCRERVRRGAAGRGNGEVVARANRPVRERGRGDRDRAADRDRQTRRRRQFGWRGGIGRRDHDGGRAGCCRGAGDLTAAGDAEASGQTRRRERVRSVPARRGHGCAVGAADDTGGQSNRIDGQRGADHDGRSGRRGQVRAGRCVGNGDGRRAASSGRRGTGNDSRGADGQAGRKIGRREGVRGRAAGRRHSGVIRCADDTGGQRRADGEAAYDRDVRRAADDTGNTGTGRDDGGSRGGTGRYGNGGRGGALRNIDARGDRGDGVVVGLQSDRDTADGRGARKRECQGLRSAHRQRDVTRLEGEVRGYLHTLRVTRETSGRSRDVRGSDIHARNLGRNIRSRCAFLNEDGRSDREARIAADQIHGDATHGSGRNQRDAEVDRLANTDDSAALQGNRAEGRYGDGAGIARAIAGNDCRDVRCARRLPGHRKGRGGASGGDGKGGRHVHDIGVINRDGAGEIRGRRGAERDRSRHGLRDSDGGGAEGESQRRRTHINVSRAAAESGCAGENGGAPEGHRGDAHRGGRLAFGDGDARGRGCDRGVHDSQVDHLTARLGRIAECNGQGSRGVRQIQRIRRQRDGGPGARGDGHRDRLAVDKAVVDNQLNHIGTRDIGDEGGRRSCRSDQNRGTARGHVQQSPLISKRIVLRVGGVEAAESHGGAHGYGSAGNRDHRDRRGIRGGDGHVRGGAVENAVVDGQLGDVSAGEIRDERRIGDIDVRELRRAARRNTDERPFEGERQALGVRAGAVEGNGGPVNDGLVRARIRDGRLHAGGGDGDRGGQAVIKPVVHNQLRYIGARGVGDKGRIHQSQTAEGGMTSGGNGDETPLICERVPVDIGRFGTIELNGGVE